MQNKNAYKKIISIILIMGIEDDLRKALEQQNQADKKIQNILRRITKGETTGDNVKDFLLVWENGRYNSETEQRYRSLLEELNDHQGEPVLVAYHKQVETENHGGCWGGGHDRTKLLSQQVGVLSGESSYKFDKKSGGILALSTKKSIQQGLIPYGMDRDQTWKQKKGPIPIPVIHLPELGEPNRYHEAELLIGEAKVALYVMAGKNGFDHYKNGNSIPKSLNKVVELAGERGKQKYISLLQLLGAEVPKILRD